MKKYIYKITNKINGKIYIGQALDVKKRWQGHKDQAKRFEENQSSLHAAIRKYSPESFNVEVIEGPVENYNEREIYWISYYRSYEDKSVGYNLTPGGDITPAYSGKYSDNTIKNIISDLMDASLSFCQIAERNGVSIFYVSGINQGKIRPNKELSYPIRINGNEAKPQGMIDEIIYLLVHSTLETENIARSLGIDSVIVYEINNGKHSKCPKNIEYPIRQPYQKISNYLLKQIYQDIVDCKLMFSEIEEKYNLSKATINRINQGKIFKQPNTQYPLRKSSQRVYNRNL